jgi:uncharacterized protein
MNTTTLPFPEPNADSRPYWEAARAQRLLIRRCKACGETHFMPRHACPKCWSDELEWVDSQGQGTVHSFSIVHRASLPEFASQVPFVVALVDLDEGPRMFANVIGAGALDVAIGERVRVVFEDRGDGNLIPQFTRAAA